MDIFSYALGKRAGGGGEASGSVNIISNGSHNVKQYATAVVNVPNSYAASDEGKVVESGALITQTAQNIAENGTYDTTIKNQVVVAIPLAAGEEF